MSLSGKHSIKSHDLSGLIKLIRPKQWVKNTFVLAPLAFTGLFTDAESVISSIIAMVLFCVASSATYIVNDYRDIEQDRKHPEKCLKRPLASRQVSKRQAIILLFFLYAILLAGFLYKATVMWVIVANLTLNIAYSFYLKNQPVIDIFSIAIGFVLRVYAGAMALSVPVSSWMFVTTLCLALYLAAVKRRQELTLSAGDGRRVLKYYSVSLVDRYAEMSATGALLFYSLFVMNSRPEMVITIPFVLYGLFRYWFVVECLEGGESPTDALFSDLPLILNIIAWLGVSTWAIWPTGV